MFEEPIRYFDDMVKRNRSVLDLLYGNDTFVNRVLAKHYGMPEPSGRTNGFTSRTPGLRPRRHVADGGLPHQKRAGPAHQSRQARLLGRPPTVGRSRFRLRRRLCPNCPKTKRTSAS